MCAVFVYSSSFIFLFVRLLRQAIPLCFCLYVYFVKLFLSDYSYNFLRWRPYMPLESRLFLASCFGLDLSFSIPHTYVRVLLWLVYDLCIMDVVFVLEACRQGADTQSDCRWKECQITIKSCTLSSFVFVCIASIWIDLFRHWWNFGKTPWKNLVPEDTHLILPQQHLMTRSADTSANQQTIN
jgi:hypothetical protein